MSIVEYIESLSDVYGIADFSIEKEELMDMYGEDICKYPYAIAIGHKMIEHGLGLAAVKFISICYLIGSLSYNSALSLPSYMCTFRLSHHYC